MKKTKLLIILSFVLSVVGCASSSPWDSFPYQEATAWQGIGVQAYDAMSYRSSGYTPSDVKPWIQAGFTSPMNVIQWAGANFSPSDAKAWANKGFTVEQAVDYRKKGLTVQ